MNNRIYNEGFKALLNSLNTQNTKFFIKERTTNCLTENRLQQKIITVTT